MAKYAYLIINSNASQRSQLLKAVISDNNTFTFTGISKYPVGGDPDASILLSNIATHTAGNSIPLMKERGYDKRSFVLTNNISIEIGKKIREAKLSGGETNAIYDLFNAVENRTLNALEKSEQELNEQRKLYAKDKDMLEKLDAEFVLNRSLIYDQRLMDWMALIRKYPLSRRSMLILSMTCDYNKSAHSRYQQVLEETWEAMPKEVKSNPITKNIPANLKASKDLLRLKEGDPIPSYTFTNEDNTKISLADFKGKYLFIDFWTSWCGPCRAEHYYMKKAWEQYKNKSFVILQVSMDEKKEKWLKALQQDQLPWQNTLNKTGWDEQLEKVFNFKGVPANFLISPEGKIIGRNLRGEMLEKKLAM
ncbi:MAG TPA: TlpA disulfide reductase family protein, partial [Chitinophagaceae bacterium]|nr:TlpA disulfide reductase family protein [Chitinophagaceae bacterium]